MKKVRKLPDKLSDLIDVAVDDCIEVSKLKTYILDMTSWHAVYAGVCRVCMAGAVLDRRCGFRKGTNEWPTEKELLQKIYALNGLRMGNVSYALTSLGYILPGGLKPGGLNGEQVDVVVAATKIINDDFSCRDRGRAKWSTYRKAAKMLRRVGL